MSATAKPPLYPRRLWRPAHAVTPPPRLGLVGSYCSLGFGDIVLAGGNWWVTIDSTAAPEVATPKVVTLVEPVELSVSYGTLTLPRGMRLQFVARDDSSVRIRHSDWDAVIPLSATDLS